MFVDRDNLVLFSREAGCRDCEVSASFPPSSYSICLNSKPRGLSQIELHFLSIPLAICIGNSPWEWWFPCLAPQTSELLSTSPRPRPPSSTFAVSPDLFYFESRVLRNQQTQVGVMIWLGTQPHPFYPVSVGQARVIGLKRSRP